MKQPKIKLLTRSQYKLDKGLSKGFATCGIQLSPADEAGLGNMCPMHGDCKKPCIAVTGMNAFPTHRKARIARTRLFKLFPQAFWAQLQHEIDNWKRCESGKGYQLAIRPNILSDQPIMGQTIARMNPDVMVYDYSKLKRPAERQLPNYRITYSWSERSTAADLDHCLEYNVNIAVVMNVGRGRKLPKTIELFGHVFPVHDGDTTDLRFLDPSDRCHVIGLRWKRSKDNQTKLAAAIASGFCIDPKANPFWRPRTRVAA